MNTIHGILTCCFILGCATEPAKDEPYRALAQYPGWFTEVEGCAGRTGDYSRLRFFILDENDIHAGYRLGDDIWIRAPYLDSRKVVEHEMLHVLIGDGDHRRPEWGACALFPLSVKDALGG